MTTGPFWVGDNPADLIALDLYRDEESLSSYTSATVSVVDPDGSTVQTIGPVPLVGERIAFKLPPGSLLVPGLYLFDVLLLGDGMLTAPPQPFVVQQRDGWHTLESARNEWQDAPADDAQLYVFLESSKEQCLAYAPALVGRPSHSFRQAQLLQARALWQAVKTNPDGQLDANGFQVQVYPLDRNIRALLRPRRGVPVFL